MKKRLSTKLLAIFMAVLMFVTAVPFSALAYENDNGNIKTLVAAIDAYENAMSKNIVLSNMAGAYTAYLNARKAYDAYIYGGKGDLAAAANERGTTLNGFVFKGDGSYNVAIRPNLSIDYVKWTDKNGNVTDADGAISKLCTNKVAYADNFTGANVAATYKSDIVTMNVFYGDTVLVWDGMSGDNDAPRFPVLANLTRNYGGVGVKYMEVWSLFTGNQNGSFENRKEQQGAFYKPSDDYWRERSTNDANFNVLKPAFTEYNSNSDSGMNATRAGQIAGWTGGTGDDSGGSRFDYNIKNAWSYIDGDAKNSTGSKEQDQFDSSEENKAKYYSSSVVYRNGAPNFIEGCATLYIPWSLYGWRVQPGLSAYGDFYCYGANASRATYVVDYSPLKNALDSYAGFDKVRNVGKYTEHSSEMLAMMQKIDNAFDYSPVDGHFNKYDNKTVNYSNGIASVAQQVGKDIATIVQQLNSAEPNIEEDKYTNYVNLEAKINEVKAVLANPSANKGLYTTKSWDDVEKVYLPQAIAHFANELNEGGTLYNDSTAKALHDNLTFVLRADFTPVDTLHEFSADNFKYTVDSLQAIADEYNEATKYYKETADRDNTPYTENGKIQEEANALNAILDKIPTEFKSTIPELMKALNGAIDNTDKYSVELLKEFLDGQLEKYSPEAGVKIANATVRGIDVDAYYRDALENLNQAQWPYKVTVDGTPLKDEEGNEAIFHYGDTVTIPEGNYAVKIVAGETNGKINGMPSEGGAVYVRGNMDFVSCTKDETAVNVKFLSENENRVLFAKEAVDGKINLDDVVAELSVPVESHFSKFVLNGKAVSGTIEVKDGDEIYVVYEINDNAGVYSVKLPAAEAKEYQYNARIDLKNTDESKVFAKKMGENDYRVISTSEEFTFYVCEDIEIVLIDKPETITTQVNVVSAPIASSDGVMFIGSYAETDKEVVGRGFIVDRYGKYAEAGKLTLANVEKGKIVNLSVTENINKYSNQFTFYITNCPTMEDACYVSYVTYADGTTEYSNMVKAPVAMVVG